MQDIIKLVILTLMPFFELRASIPFGIFATDLPVMAVFLICVAVNILLAPILFYLLQNVVHVVIKINVLGKLYQYWIIRTQHKIHKYVEKYGVWGLAVFIGIPLPGSGVYTGTLAAYLLGFRFREFFKAAVIGVFIAGVIVLIVSIIGNGAIKLFIKQV